MGFEDLGPELQEQAKECKSIGELEALTESVGVKLSSEELEEIAGGRVLLNGELGGGSEEPCSMFVDLDPRLQREKCPDYRMQ